MSDSPVSGNHLRVRPVLWAVLVLCASAITPDSYGAKAGHLAIEPTEPQHATASATQQAAPRYYVSYDSTLHGALRMPDLTFSDDELKRAAASNPHLKEFLERHEAFNTGEHLGRSLTTSEWMSTHSPWAPYLSRPFADGLVAADKERRRAALEANDCKMVEALARKGLARLYPEIAPLLARGSSSRRYLQAASSLIALEVDFNFRIHVLPVRSLDYTHCTAIDRLLRARDQFARRSLTPRALNTNKLRHDRKNDETTIEDGHPYGIRRCLAIKTLTWLAVTRDFAPAIRDLLTLSENPGLLVLTPEEEFYYLSRAFHLGLDVSARKTRYLKRRQTLTADVRAVLEEAVYRPDRAARVLPRWDCPAEPLRQR